MKIYILYLIGSPVLEEQTSQNRLNTIGQTTGLPLVKKKTSSTVNGAGRKRKSFNNKVSTPKVRRTDTKKSECEEDQSAPSLNRLASGVGAVADLFNLRQGGQKNSTGIFTSSSISPPLTQVPEFAFSNMMRKMASKYQQNDLIEVVGTKSLIDNPQE